MRVLVTTQPGSHLRAVMPAAQALQHRGHDVLVAAPRPMHADAASYGFDAVEVSLDFPGGPHATRGQAIDPKTREKLLGQMIMGERVLRRARDLIAIAGEWHPDVILRDSSELGGSLAGDALDIPHVSVQSAGQSATIRAGREALAEAMSGHRAALGLPPDPELRSLFRHLRANLMPPSWDPEAAGRPNTRCYRQTAPHRPSEQPPDWLGELPEGRPVLLAALGTQFHNVPGRVEGLLAALSGIDCSAIVAVGAGKDVDAYGLQPPHLRVVDAIAQPAVLECCDAFLTHGGFNSVRESLRAGVPMIVTPVMADQPPNAQRCGALGLGIAFTQEPPAPEAIADACRTVLGDPAFRSRARALQRQIVALPSLDQLAIDVEQLVTVAWCRASMTSTPERC